MRKHSVLSIIIFLFTVLLLTLSPPNTTQAAAYKGTIKKLDSFKSGKETFQKGYYYYPNKQVRARKAGVIFFSQKKMIQGHAFKGYYFYDNTGLITTREWGIVKLNQIKATNGKLFNGYYYRGKGGMILQKPGLRKITQTNGINAYYHGYHYFDKKGKMITEKKTQYLNLTYNGHHYKGYYCFGGKGGKMIRKRSLIKHEERYYFVRDSYGKCLTDGRKYLNGFLYTFNKKGVGQRRSNLGGLKNTVSRMIGSYDGTWSVYVKRLDNDDYFVINNTSLYAASIIKPFVMASFYQQVANKKLTNTDSLTSAVRDMITVSDNEAYNRLVRAQGNNNFLTGKNVVNEYLSNNKYSKTGVHHTLHPSSSSSLGDGKSNTTSVQDCGKLLEQIHKGTCVNKSSSKKMLNYLLGQTRRWKIPAGLPSGTKIANKTGETNAADHDIAIVYGKKCTYIICVMSINASSSSSRISGLSRVVYNTLNK